MNAHRGAAATVDAPAVLLAEVARAAERTSCAAFLVGGAVRDELLGRPSKDVDVAVEAAGERLTRFLDVLADAAGWTRRARHERFGTATFETPSGVRVDVAATRRETYARPAALPVVMTGVAIGEDLLRRDFTIHAMARPLATRGVRPLPLLDPLGGARDLAGRTIRLLHEASLADDPTRIFRAARYTARLGFSVAADFARALDACREARALDALSPDRLRRALSELLDEETAPEALELIRDWGVLREIAAGLAPPGEPLPATIPERWGALLAPLDAREREKVALRLNFSRALRRAVGLR